MPEGNETTQANPAAKAGQGDDAPKYVTEEQLNRAISARLTDFQKKVEKTIEGVKVDPEAIAKLVAESISASKPADEPKGKSKDSQPDPEVNSLKKALADQKKTVEEMQAKLAQERASVRNSKLRQAVQDEMTKHGFSEATRAKHALGHLVDVEKRVRYSDDESDSIVFRDEDGQDVDLATGIKSWSRSDEAKLYMPPKGVQGSGSNPGGKGSPKDDQPRLGEVLQNAFFPTS
jgi:hypothetical protein